MYKEQYIFETFFVNIELCVIREIVINIVGFFFISVLLFLELRVM